MTNFEYHVVLLVDELGIKALGEALDSHGAAGWELVLIRPFYGSATKALYVFKRPLEPVPPEETTEA